MGFEETNKVDLSKGKRLFKDDYWVSNIDGDYIYITDGFEVELHTLEKGRLNKEQYIDIGNFDGDLAPSQTRNGYPCVINKSGDTIIKLTSKFWSAYNNYKIYGNFVFVRGAWLDKNNNAYSNFDHGNVYNSNGDRLIKCSSIVSTKGNLAVISQGNSKVLINFNGKQKYSTNSKDDLIIVDENTILVSKKNKLFVIDGEGKKKNNIDLSQYDFEQVLSDNRILFVSKTSQNYVVMDNEFNVGVIYSNKNDIPTTNENKLLKRKELVYDNQNRQALLDEKGNLIVDFVNHNIIPFKDKIFIDSILMEYDNIKINYNLSFTLYGKTIEKTFDTSEEREKYKNLFESYISIEIADIDKMINDIIKEKENQINKAKCEAFQVINRADEEITKKLVKKLKESDK